MYKENKAPSFNSKRNIFCYWLQKLAFAFKLPVKKEYHAIIPTGKSCQVLVKLQGKSFEKKNTMNIGIGHDQR